jgi:hypothetical protein
LVQRVFVGGVEFFRSLLERGQLGAGGLLGERCGLARIDRIEAARQFLAGVCRQLTGQRERH